MVLVRRLGSSKLQLFARWSQVEAFIIHVVEVSPGSWHMYAPIHIVIFYDLINWLSSYSYTLGWLF